jgi:hypothetical protein
MGGIANVKTVEWQRLDAPSRELFTKYIENDPRELKSIVKAVVDDANMRKDLEGLLPVHGARWSASFNRKRYNVAYHWPDSDDYRSATFVWVTRIAAR